MSDRYDQYNSSDALVEAEKRSYRRLATATAVATVLMWPASSFAQFALSGTVPYLVTVTAFIVPPAMLLINASMGVSRVSITALPERPAVLGSPGIGVEALGALLSVLIVLPMITAAGMVGAVPPINMTLFVAFLGTGAVALRLSARAVALLVGNGIVRVGAMVVLLLAPAVVAGTIGEGPAAPLLTYPILMQIRSVPGGNADLSLWTTGILGTPTLFHIIAAGLLTMVVNRRPLARGSEE